MAIVDPEILQQLERTSCKTIPVLVICNNECESVVKALEQAGIQVTNTESSIMGSIGAEITAEQLEIIKAVPGVSAIEYDQEAKTF